MRPAVLWLAIVAGCFSAIVAAGMIWAHFHRAAYPWPQPPEMAALQVELQKTLGDAVLKERIRQYDAQLREQFSRREFLLNRGRWMLLAGLLVMLGAAKGYVALKQRPAPRPAHLAAEMQDWAALGRRNSVAVGIVALVVAAGLGGLAWLGHGRLPGEAVAAAEPVAEPVARAAAPGTIWPQFRGPTGQGLVSAGDWPNSWDATTGKNIVWKCPIAGKGNSSPVVWGDRVFVTAADVNKRWVHGFDATTGKALWSTEIKSPPGSAAANFTDEVLSGYAAPTPATDGKRVYVTYANADVAAVDFNGKQLWVRNLGKPQSSYGLASSPILYKDLLILQHDQGAEAEARLSSIMALDTRTGKTVWQTLRPVPNSWSTPIIIRPDPAGDRVELITCGNPWAIAYDPATGRELWRADALKDDVAATPVFANGLVFVVSKRQACAIRPGGSGDVTKTHLVWFSEAELPDVVSPLANDKYYLQVASEGKVTCLSASDGHKVWDNDFSVMFQPSPSLVGDMVYLPTQDGHMILFKLAAEFTLAGNCAVDDQLTASSAFAGGRIFIRGDNNLYCIGQTGTSGAAGK